MSTRIVAHRRAGPQRHVLQALLVRRSIDSSTRASPRIRHSATQRHALARIGAPGDERRELAGVQEHLGIEGRVGIALQSLPVLHGGIPVGTGRRMGTAPT